MGLIGISGHKQVGKDTACAIIQREFPMIHKSFGKQLKVVAASLLGCDYKDFESEDFKNKKSIIRKESGGYYTNREILQLLGTDVGRTISPDMWIDLAFKGYTDKDSWIFTDVRFPNEAKAIKDRGGKLIRIERNTGLVDTHISETALDDYKDWDLVIDNNGTKNDLKDIILQNINLFVDSGETVIERLKRENEETPLYSQFDLVSYNDTQITFSNEIEGFVYYISISVLPSTIEVCYYIHNYYDCEIEKDFEFISAAMPFYATMESIYDWFMDCIDHSDIYIESISNVLEDISSLPKESKELLIKILEH